ncbi:MAG: hypothetical protein AAGE76_15195 [Pseudomonadota bacterium]
MTKATIKQFSHRVTPRWIRLALTAWHRRATQRLNRAAFLNMLSLDAHILRDIGVSRGDVEWAAQLPLRCNAAAELRRLALSRRA